MRKIQVPDFRKFLAENPKEIFSLLGRFGAVDHKGRYLHWADFRRRVPTDIDPLAAWAATKLSRMSLLKTLELVAEDGQPFRYCTPDALESVLHLIDRLCAPLLNERDSALVGQSERNRYLVESLMMEEAISSAQLEGAATTRKVAKEMLESERPPRSEDERMIFNNYLLMKETKRRKDEPLSLELICALHAIATDATEHPNVQPGELRRSDDIVVGGRDGEVVHRPPAFVSLAQRLERLCVFANTRHDGREGRAFIHPAIKAIILHFMLGYEHPFADGNGRTARALFYWLMLKQGYWPFEYISISRLLKEAPIQYGESYLFSESDEFDLTYFIVYQAGIIQRAVEQFLEYLERRRREQLELMLWLDEQGIGEKLNYRQGQLLRKVLRHPGRLFSVKEVKNEFGVAENTARTDLQTLARFKVLTPTREGKSVYYIARGDAVEQLKKTAR